MLFISESHLGCSFLYFNNYTHIVYYLETTFSTDPWWLSRLVHYTSILPPFILKVCGFEPPVFPNIFEVRLAKKLGISLVRASACTEVVIVYL